MTVNESAHSAAFVRAKRMRAYVARQTLCQFVKRDENWYLACWHEQCRQAICQVTVDDVGFCYSMSEMLSMAVAHQVQCHDADLHDDFEEDYA